jgi:chemotaxis family two-component system response regulator Rcp1
MDIMSADLSGKVGKVVDILLVEDNPGDARLAMEALKQGKVQNRLFHVEDGVEAINFLRRRAGHEASPRPDLILLDLNLPKKDGREVLAEIKADEDLKRIPVVVLTISKDEEDVLRTYNLHANCYITKPIDFYQFMKVVRSIEDFWMTIVRLPPNGQP